MNLWKVDGKHYALVREVVTAERLFLVELDDSETKDDASVKARDRDDSAVEIANSFTEVSFDDAKYEVSDIPERMTNNPSYLHALRQLQFRAKPEEPPAPTKRAAKKSKGDDLDAIAEAVKSAMGT